MLRFVKNALSSNSGAPREVGLLQANSSSRRVLNVGGNSKAIPLPAHYDGWEHILLDIDSKGRPDVLCDARALAGQPPAAYDSVYCSHNLEHYYRHDVPKVLHGFLHVLKEGGFAYLRVPDMEDLMQTVVRRGLDIDDFLYESPAGPITVRDVIYGYGREIESSRNDFYAHKTGFTRKSLTAVLKESGLRHVFVQSGNLEITAIAFKGKPASHAIALLGLPETAFAAEYPQMSTDDPASASEKYRKQGNALLAQGLLVEAAECYRQAVMLAPGFAAAHLNLGFVRKELNQPEAAKQHLEEAIRINPKLEDAHYLLGLLAEECGDIEAAIAQYGQAIELKPDFELACRDLCRVLFRSGQIENARRTIGMGLAMNPNNADFHFYEGNLYLHDKALAKAVASYQKALSLSPGNAAVLNNMGKALLEQGQVDEAVECYRQALQLDAGDLAVEAASCLLFASAYRVESTPEQYMNEARRYGRLVAEKAIPYTSWPCSQGAPQALRVGMVSGDFLNHPVGYFLEDILKHVDLGKMQLIAFPTITEEDALTARIKPVFSGWHCLAGLSDEAAAARIRAEGIHVLIDLAGHTSHNRLPVFAWRPAPVQVSWLGYFASTGVPGMDYLLADKSSVPESDKPHFTETIWYLPDTRLCFSPPEISARTAVSPLPARRNGFITYGTFQNLAKLNNRVLAVWARVLQAVPTARLRVQCKQMQAPAMMEALKARMAQAGIATGRVTIAGPCSRDDYLASHAQVDAILDTFPYPGGTTTCEALWMGVPTLTMTGDTLLSRQGASMLACIGLADWIAVDEADYVAKAMAFAADIDGLAMLRQGLRQKVLATTLFDAPRFAINLENALHGMWQRHLEGKWGCA